MGLTKDGLKTVRYVLFSAIYSIIYHLVSFSPDGIQEVGGWILLISSTEILGKFLHLTLHFRILLVFCNIVCYSERDRIWD